MKVSEITDRYENYQTKSPTNSVKVCVNGLLMSKAGIGHESQRPHLFMSTSLMMKIFCGHT